MFPGTQGFDEARLPLPITASWAVQFKFVQDASAAGLCMGVRLWFDRGLPLISQDVRRPPACGAEFKAKNSKYAWAS